MRRNTRVVVGAVVAGVLALLPVVGSASSAVLTAGAAAPGGSRVSVGAPLEAGRTGGAGSSLTVDGGAVTCSASDVDAAVETNPAEPGVATLSVTGFSFSGCASSVPGTTGVEGVSFDNLPYTMSIDDRPTPTGTLSAGGGGPIQLTVRFQTASGPPLHCTYEGAPSMKAHFAGGDLGIDATFDTVQPGDPVIGVCAQHGHFSAKYGALVDLEFPNQQLVFVN